LSKPGRFEAEQPVVTGHSAAVLDFDFNPFNDNIIASGSDDQTVKVWDIPVGGLTANLTTPVVDLHGHGRKVTFLRFHPTASNVLASASADLSVKLWDIEKGSEMNCCAGNTNVSVRFVFFVFIPLLLRPGQHSDLIQDIVWDSFGDNYATSCKDKSVRICDARSGSIGSVIECAHEGSKSVKLTYLGSMDKLVTVGFSKQSQRQFKVWDLRNLSAELKKNDIDQAAGSIMPFFDPDTCLLYLAGKGDGNVRYYEMVDENPYFHGLNEYKSSVSAKGMAMLPKRGLNIMGCETARLLKLTTNSVEPLSFTVPRKSEAFQDDIYPDTFAGMPSHSADDWLGGSSVPPVLKSLNPSGASSSATPGGSPPKPVVRVKSTSVLQGELDTALARIKDLEDKLAAAGVSIE
jgi:coronin-1B/1C/6